MSYIYKKKKKVYKNVMDKYLREIDTYRCNNTFEDVILKKDFNITWFKINPIHIIYIKNKNELNMLKSGVLVDSCLYHIYKSYK